MSIDLLMYKGDLGITQDKSGKYDLVIEEAGQSLLKRTVVTPPSWVRTWVIEHNKVNLMDDEYGDRIYLQLSDPLDIHWVSIAKNHLQNSIDFVLNEERLSVLSLSVSISSSDGLNPDTADIQISYSYDGKDKVYQERLRL